MKTRILAIILSVCLVGAIGWGFTNYKGVGELKQEIAEQREEVEHWKSQWEWQRERAFSYEDEIVRLEGELEYLNKELAEGLLINIDLTSGNDGLKRQVKSLSESLEKWETAYNDLLANYNQLTRQMEELTKKMEDIDFLQNLLQLLLL